MRVPGEYAMKASIPASLLIALCAAAVAVGQSPEGAAPDVIYRGGPSTSMSIAELMRDGGYQMPTSPLGPTYTLPRDEALQLKRKAEMYFDKQRINREAREARPLSVRRLPIRAENGQLNWPPLLLLHADFAAERAAIDDLDARGGLSSDEMILHIDAMAAKLRQAVKDVAPFDYLRAKQYLDALKAAAKDAPVSTPMQAPKRSDLRLLSWPAALSGSALDGDREEIVKLSETPENSRRINQLVARMESQLAKDTFQISPAQFREAQEFLHDFKR
jgi:hypothetical protein